MLSAMLGKRMPKNRAKTFCGSILAAYIYMLASPCDSALADQLAGDPELGAHCGW
jgi:hypothetical protein